MLPVKKSILFSLFLSLLACIASCEKSKQTKTQAAEEKTALEMLERAMPDSGGRISHDTSVIEEKTALEIAMEEVEESKRNNGGSSDLPEVLKTRRDSSGWLPAGGWLPPDTSGYATFYAGDLPIEMVFVQGGTFKMGCTIEQEDYCLVQEWPPHSVTISDFYIGKYEVTQKQWFDVMATDAEKHIDLVKQTFHKRYGYDSPFNPYVCEVGDSYPICYVSLNDIQEFIWKLNERTGKKYRLPTEAEWEYAARGGNRSRGHIFSGSDNADEVAWHYKNSGKKIHPVGSKLPNELGIYDMSGNMNEWVNDWMDNGYSGYNYYTAEAKTNPQGPEKARKDSLREFRGGDKDLDSYFSARVSSRSSEWAEEYCCSPNDRHYEFGFRLAMEP